MKKKLRRVVLVEGKLEASLLEAFVTESVSGNRNPIRISEKDLQENYRKKVRLVLEVLE